MSARRPSSHRHILTAVTVVAAAVAVLCACTPGGQGAPAGADVERTETRGADASPSPTPSSTETPVPRGGDTLEPAVDPRCTRQFPGRALTIIHESDLEGRADLWPEVPDWAALCWTEWENEFTQVGWYATDPGMSQAEVYRTYEHALMGVGQAARVDSDDGEILTGIVPPQHSFWVLAERDHYRVTWSFDGEYAE